jgi:hypothetical protein
VLGAARRAPYDGHVIARVHGAPLLAVLAIGMLAGCGSSGTGLFATHRAAKSTRSPTSAPSITETNPTPVPPANPQTVPTPPPTGIPANPAAVRVIRAWSDALRRGDVDAAARYFALPSVMINGAGVNGLALVNTIETRVQAQAANASLPCGAKFISADQRGRYVNALFRLTNRPGPGGGCGSGAGQTARTNFVIVGGLIAQWIRAPDEPGDNRRGGAPPAPTGPAPPGPQV